MSKKNFAVIWYNQVNRRSEARYVTRASAERYYESLLAAPDVYSAEIWSLDEDGNTYDHVALWERA